MKKVSFVINGLTINGLVPAYRNGSADFANNVRHWILANFL